MAQKMKPGWIYVSGRGSHLPSAIYGAVADIWRRKVAVNYLRWASRSRLFCDVLDPRAVMRSVAHGACGPGISVLRKLVDASGDALFAMAGVSYGGE